ncbi:alpha/beta hydrolase [Pseudomonas stutzeri]|uniref:Alpha/beta hydrolase n=1 Tax=Stutzerimonas stutzeri TaxID=316 RepID=A0A2N8S1W5_STUST|nr:alpha/beta hydrolase [Stutzerimonas stutzeri]MCQ4295764.1 alpha/beta hydrolase [Stutzerimonas stutzeri]PNF80604.1 alpha/beta hydrolase [Stutzerimonas stutzeri]
MKIVLKILLAAIVLLVIAVAVGMTLSWAPPRPVESLTERWAPEPSRFIEIAGMRVHIRDEGRRDDPAPLVLLHGTSASLHTWEGVVDQLKPQRRVISLDLPGFGLTGPFPDGNYRMDHYVEFLSTLLDRLEVERAVLLGNSFGGQLAWEMALDQPQRVAQLVLIDAAGYPRQSTSVPIGFKLAGIPGLAPIMANILPRRLVESSTRSVYGDPGKVTPELVDRYYELTLREGNREALRERFKQVPAVDNSKRIASVKTPTLIIWGGRDGLIPPLNARRFKDDIAGSQLVIFDDLGHVPQEEDPLQVAEAVRDFLAQP